MLSKLSSTFIFESIDGLFIFPKKFQFGTRPFWRSSLCYLIFIFFVNSATKLRMSFLLLDAILILTLYITSFYMFHLVIVMFFKKTGKYCLVLTSLLFKTGIGCINKRVIMNVQRLKKTYYSWGGVAVFESLQPSSYLEERTDLMYLGFHTLATKERHWLWKV